MKLTYEDTSLISKEDVSKEFERLLPYITHLRKVSMESNANADEASVLLPYDDDLFSSVQKLAHEKGGNRLKYIIVIGIGGSNLGTKAVYDALFGHTDLLERTRYPKMIFLDTNDSSYLSAVKKFLHEIGDLEEIVINTISKSGTTTETAVNLEIVLSILKKQFTIKDILDRLILTTSATSKMYDLADAFNVSRLTIPEKVPGRYSVFSAVGLLPLTLVGLDVRKLCVGARDALNGALDDSLSMNLSAESAIVMYLSHKEGKNINVHFIFHPELESLGKWYAQLLGESIGKEKDIAGKIVHKGMTPLISIGSTDLHSVGQLYFGGPHNKITTFVSSEREDKNIQIPKEQVFNLVKGLSEKSVDSVMRAILEGTEREYKKQKLSYMDLELSDISEQSLGEFLQFKMIEVMYLAKLFNVNAFNQPAVESYKKETREILESKKK